ncbi:unnamed protein product [Amoebophrya sp. A120]|nr:unnamed protein product [Amoebophrya sp. A120]|eukprot:GSA120T00021437001.1
MHFPGWNVVEEDVERGKSLMPTVAGILGKDKVAAEEDGPLGGVLDTMAAPEQDSVAGFLGGAKKRRGNRPARPDEMPIPGNKAADLRAKKNPNWFEEKGEGAEEFLQAAANKAREEFLKKALNSLKKGQSLESIDFATLMKEEMDADVDGEDQQESMTKQGKRVVFGVQKSTNYQYQAQRQAGTNAGTTTNQKPVVGAGMNTQFAQIQEQARIAKDEATLRTMEQMQTLQSMGGSLMAGETPEEALMRQQIETHLQGAGGGMAAPRMGEAVPLTGGAQLVMAPAQPNHQMTLVDPRAEKKRQKKEQKKKKQLATALQNLDAGDTLELDTLTLENMDEETKKLMTSDLVITSTGSGWMLKKVGDKVVNPNAGKKKNKITTEAQQAAADEMAEQQEPAPVIDRNEITLDDITDDKIAALEAEQKTKIVSLDDRLRAMDALREQQQQLKDRRKQERADQGLPPIEEGNEEDELEGDDDGTGANKAPGLEPMVGYGQEQGPSIPAAFDKSGGITKKRKNEATNEKEVNLGSISIVAYGQQGPRDMLNVEVDEEGKVTTKKKDDKSKAAVPAKDDANKDEFDAMVSSKLEKELAGQTKKVGQILPGFFGGSSKQKEAATLKRKSDEGTSVSVGGAVPKAGGKKLKITTDEDEALQEGKKKNSLKRQSNDNVGDETATKKPFGSVPKAKAPVKKVKKFTIGGDDSGSSSSSSSDSSDDDEFHDAKSKPSTSPKETPEEAERKRAARAARKERERQEKVLAKAVPKSAAVSAQRPGTEGQAVVQKDTYQLTDNQNTESYDPNEGEAMDYVQQLQMQNMMMQQSYASVMQSITDEAAGPGANGPVLGRKIYKTRMCRFMHEKGWCPHGEICTFAHNVEELPPSYKRELCQAFQLLGTCQHGINCKYAHGVAELRGQRTAAGGKFVEDDDEKIVCEDVTGFGSGANNVPLGTPTFSADAAPPPPQRQQPPPAPAKPLPNMRTLTESSIPAESHIPGFSQTMLQASMARSQPKAAGLRERMGGDGTASAVMRDVDDEERRDHRRGGDREEKGRDGGGSRNKDGYWDKNGEFQFTGGGKKREENREDDYQRSRREERERERDYGR